MQVKATKVHELAMGAVHELLDDAFKKVIENIQDVNTKATQPREISLKIKLMPTENREACAYELGVGAKLAPNKPVAGHIYVGLQNGEPVAFEHNPDQRSFDFHEQDKEII